MRSNIDTEETGEWFGEYLPIFLNLYRQLPLNQRGNLSSLHAWVYELWEKEFIVKFGYWLDQPPQCLKDLNYWRTQFHGRFFNLLHNGNRRFSGVVLDGTVAEGESHIAPVADDNNDDAGNNNDDVDNNDNDAGDNNAGDNNEAGLTVPSVQTAVGRSTVSRSSIVVNAVFTGKAKNSIIDSIVIYLYIIELGEMEDEITYITGQWQHFSAVHRRWLEKGPRALRDLTYWKNLYIAQFPKVEQLKAKQPTTAITQRGVEQPTITTIQDEDDSRRKTRSMTLSARKVTDASRAFNSVSPSLSRKKAVSASAVGTESEEEKDYNSSIHANDDSSYVESRGLESEDDELLGDDDYDPGAFETDCLSSTENPANTGTKEDTNQMVRDNESDPSGRHEGSQYAVVKDQVPQSGGEDRNRYIWAYMESITNAIIRTRSEPHRVIEMIRRDRPGVDWLRFDLGGSGEQIHSVQVEDEELPEDLAEHGRYVLEFTGDIADAIYETGSDPLAIVDMIFGSATERDIVGGEHNTVEQLVRGESNTVEQLVSGESNTVEQLVSGESNTVEQAIGNDANINKQRVSDGGASESDSSFVVPVDSSVVHSEQVQFIDRSEDGVQTKTNLNGSGPGKRKSEDDETDGNNKRRRNKFSYNNFVVEISQNQLKKRAVEGMQGFMVGYVRPEESASLDLLIAIKKPDGSVEQEHVSLRTANIKNSFTGHMKNKGEYRKFKSLHDVYIKSWENDNDVAGAGGKSKHD